MSADSMYSLDFLSSWFSILTASRYSNNAESDAFFKDSCKPPIEITRPAITAELKQLDKMRV